MPAPFTTPVDWSIPFDAAAADAIAAGINKTNVHEAIIQAKQQALSNDRYPILCYYNGNANTNRYLEIFPARASSTAPLIVPENSNITTLVFACEANSSGTIQIYNLTTATVLYTVTFTNQKLRVVTGLMLPVAAQDRIAVRVNSGSLHKPYGAFWVNTASI